LDEVLPFYGNTHTTTSVTGHQSTCFRHEARQLVAESVNAKITGRAAADVVLFTGNGTTAAAHKLVESLGLKTPLPPGSDESLRPVVFTSSYEHHSNLLPWRESVADVVTVDYCTRQGVSLPHLRSLLFQYKSRRLKIGAFSAASNVTGVLTDVDEVSVVLHQANAFAVFDYATAAPYVRMDMNPVRVNNPGLAYKDAILFSGHKFIGGPGSPGVLVAKKSLLLPQDEAPTRPGGGTVFFVSEGRHRYLSNREEREEAGTPAVLGDIRLGMIMHIKSSVGAAHVHDAELRLEFYARQRLQEHPSIVLLGRLPAIDATEGDSNGSGCGSSSENAHHLPIFSFLIRCDQRFLHYNFVCALLNDMFGVQARGGCQCAGPFSQKLLGLSAGASRALEAALLDKAETLRPGYSRISFPYWASRQEIDYVIDSVLFVAKHGWLFLPFYRHNPKTGEWAHTTRITKFPERKWLSRFSLVQAQQQHQQEQSEPTPDGENDNDQIETKAQENLVTPNRRIQPDVPGTGSLAWILAKQWGGDSESEILGRRCAAAEAEAIRLSQSHAKRVKRHKKIIDAATKSAGTGRSEPNEAASADAAGNKDNWGGVGGAGLRWFVVEDDILPNGTDPSHARLGGATSSCAPVGPVQPQHWLSSELQQDDSITQTVGGPEDLTVYARLRGDTKFRESNGVDGPGIPRYLKISSAPSHLPTAQKVEAGSIQEEEQKSKQTKQQPLSSGQKEAQVATSEVETRGKSSGHTKEEKAGEIADRAVVASLPPPVPEPLPDGVKPGATIAENGKVLSGPGLTYLPVQSPEVCRNAHLLPPKKV
jgi:selenocysteine lyase/cysteine desulfurase